MSTEIEKRIMFRGVRLRDFQLDNLKKRGMEYYWNDPEYAISDIFRVLEKFHKVSQLGRNPLLRAYVLEAARVSRLQIWCTENKFNAQSYARDTPEIISCVLRAIGIEVSKQKKYLEERFGKPYVVTFEHIEEIHGINTVVGNHVLPENIISVEEVDMTKPDPDWTIKLGSRQIPETQEKEEDILAI